MRDMSYNTVTSMASDQSLLNRCIAAAAEEGQVNPVEWTQNRIWHLCSQPGWDDAWAYAIAAGNESPGDDEAVITDGMILAAVQGLRDNT